MAKPEYKLEGDKIIVSFELATGIDNDKDGMKSLELKGAATLTLDGSEVLDEVVKSNELVAKLKEKLGLG